MLWATEVSSSCMVQCLYLRVQAINAYMKGFQRHVKLEEGSCNQPDQGKRAPYCVPETFVYDIFMRRKVRGLCVHGDKHVHLYVK